MYVFWYHNERMVNYDSGRGVVVDTMPGDEGIVIYQSIRSALNIYLVDTASYQTYLVSWYLYLMVAQNTRF